MAERTESGSSLPLTPKHRKHEFEDVTWRCRWCGDMAQSGTVVCVPHPDYEDRDPGPLTPKGGER